MPVGLKGKIYRNTGTFGTPVWTEVPEFENVTFDPIYDQAESNSRDSPIKRIKLGLVAVTASARLKTIPGNLNYEALMDAFMLGNVVDFLILDGDKDVVGSRGIRADCHLAEAPQDQGMSIRQFNAITIVPADTTNMPKWAKVVTGPVIHYAAPGGAFAP